MKIWAQIFPNIRNNLRKKGFENFEDICMYSEVPRKLTYVWIFCGNLKEMRGKF